MVPRLAAIQAWRPGPILPRHNRPILAAANMGKKIEALAQRAQAR
jgi:hypothetical protein